MTVRLPSFVDARLTLSDLTRSMSRSVTVPPEAVKEISPLDRISSIDTPPTATRALLMRTKGQWIVSACGDASLIEYGNLQRIGMSRAAAKKLAEKIRVAESALTEDEKRQISKFNGVLKLDDARETPRS